MVQLVGPSMEPTLNNSSTENIVVTEHVTSRLRTLRRGDIVVVRSPQDPRNLVCKRITAMAGDLVDDGASGYLKVPKGHIWLLGDNQENSTDSRDYGPVPYGLVRGRVCYKVWPLSEFGKIKSPAIYEEQSLP
ncbi:mitochondrial inner membrane protease subunit 1 isoform X1 [Nematostella vectensis]|uniref:mitochondrial inner membrane protease subunit 1 isoform X1 n=1 Tax=Nematostella vectensis TaxID=45351 RepID=UPI0013902A7C|nr:mitochondrial inner membrane protease subunit 1 isoform X1 [Nematostella vectensis]